MQPFIKIAFIILALEELTFVSLAFKAFIIAFRGPIIASMESITFEVPFMSNDSSLYSLSFTNKHHS